MHAHLAPPSFTAALERADPATARRFGNLVDARQALTAVDDLLAGMDAAGVGLALLSVPPPAAGLAAPAGAATLAAAMNDELLAIAAAHPDRLRVLLTVPLSDPCAAADEVERLAGRDLVAGVCALAHHVERPLDDAGYAAFWSVVAANRLPVLLHPAFEEPPRPLRDWALPTALDAVFSTSVVAARLLLSGLLDREPHLDLVVPHLGGTLPYLAQRLADQSGTGRAAHDVPHYLRTRTWLDTCSYHPPALRCALETVGAGRLLLGSDHPFRGPMARATHDLRAAGLPAADEQRVLRDNALSLFRLAPAASAPTPDRQGGHR